MKVCIREAKYLVIQDHSFLSKRQALFAQRAKQRDVAPSSLAYITGNKHSAVNSSDVQVSCCYLGAGCTQKFDVTFPVRELKKYIHDVVKKAENSVVTEPVRQHINVTQYKLVESNLYH